MEIKTFCRGSKKLAIKYRYYLKYNLLVALCIIVPVSLFLLDNFELIHIGKLRINSATVAILFIIWLVVLIIGFIGFGQVNGLTYQIFGITTDNRLVRFYFKDMLRDGKVVLHFKPYHKRETRMEYVDVIKKKEEIIKDTNFEEYLCTLCNDHEVQKQSDILFEVMDNIRVVKDKRTYLEIKYTIGRFKTKKKVKIYKNLTNMNELNDLVKSEKEL
ncbi:MAG: hypothetical protein Q4G58_02100 [bacterium]|nr:hypothetical protein [bacterium]